MTQYVINIGTIPNDGTGDPLRTAFNETNLNFDQVFAAGPVLSNIQIANNKILTTNTNGNLVLAPNGVGVVVSNVSIVPNTANIRNLGSATNRWATVYTQYLNVTAGSLTVPAIITSSISSDDSTFVTIADGLNVDGDIETHGNVTADYFIGDGSQLTGIVANTTYGNSNVVTLLAGFGSNTVSTTGNISGGFILGNGSQLTGLAATYGNANVVTLLAGFGSNTVSTTGNISGGFIFGNGSQLTGLPATYGNANVATFMAAFGSNTISSTGNITTTGNISGGFIFGNGSQLTGLPATYGNSNVVAYGQSGWAGNIIPSGNAVYSLGNATNQWNDLYVSNATIFMNNVPVSLSAGNVLSVNGNAVLQNDSNTSIATTGNITANTFFTTANLKIGINPDIVVAGNHSEIKAFGSADSLQIGWEDTYPGITDVAYIQFNDYYGGIGFITGNTQTALHGMLLDEVGNLSISGPGFQANIISANNIGLWAGNAVTITSNRLGLANTWTFGTNGNLTLPGNIIAINYANGNRVTGGITFNGETVIGTGTSNTQSGLYLAPDPVSLTNDLYLRVRGNIIDEPTHIHFDTGNNQYYNQYIGDDNKYILLANTGNVVVNTNDNAGNSAQWTFNNFGTLTLPGGSQIRPVGANLDIVAGTGSYVNLTTSDGDSYMGVDNGGGYIATAGGQWLFGTTGNLTAPGNISAVGNVTAGNISAGSGTITGGNVNGANFNGNVAFGTGTVGGSGNITGGNLITTGSGGAITMTGGNITGVGNISAGNISATGNVTAANFFGNGSQLTGVAGKTTGTWNVTAGTNNYSFTLPINNTYQLWVLGNIPNGIIVYNATVSVSNTNVPVIGQQFAWNYEGGGNILMFTSIPAQIVGTAGTISNAAPAVANTNVFTFGINNTSGNNVTVNYGWAQIS